MDTPVRQYQKQKDYRRHKLFRKINRRRKAERQQAINAPMKELRRRLKRYKDGKDEKKVYLDQSIDGVNLWRDNQTGGYFYQEGNGPRIDLTPFNTLGSDDPTTWSFLDAEGREYNPRRQYTGPMISQTTDAQRVANEVRDVQNTRTWRSNVADQLHNFGDALMWSTMAMNPEGEALMMKASEKAASLRKLTKPIFDKAALAIQNYRYPLGRPQIPENFLTIKPQVRTRVGDVEIDNPNVLYHTDWGDGVGAMAKINESQGIPTHGGPIIRDGFLYPGTSYTEGQKAYTWWNLGKPWNTPSSGSRLTTTNVDNPLLFPVRSSKEPIGQWNGRAGFVTKNEYVANEPVDVSNSTYVFRPDYGWRRVFAEETPTLSWADATRTPQITAENATQLLQQQSKRLGGDLKYDGPDLFEKYIYGRKINGLSVDPFDVAKQPYSDALNEQWSKDVAIGLSADAKQSLLDETIARNVRAFEEQGVDPLAIQEYRNRAAALMDDVRVGRYTNQDYIKAGKDDIGGFYDDKRNFLSVNTESGFPDGFVEKHEGRHLLDYKLDDDILMGTNADRNNLGSDFDSDATAKAMRMAVQKQNDVLTKAYDMDFVNLPNTKYAGSLKGYPHMERETVTTNADSRRILFDKKHANNWSLELKDKLIDKVPKEDIFDAVEQANGYGRRYIQFLRDNGKLTEEKANQFREAMKYKGILAVPMAVGAGYGLIGGSNDITFNKGKDSGIHIKPQNRGKFTALKKRTGKSASWFKAHGTPAQKKMATFALNARKWKHK